MSDRLAQRKAAVRVAIHCAQVEDVLAVPIHAVFLDEGSPFCYVDLEEHFEIRFVEAGVQNENLIEVRSGLSEGENVALSRPERKHTQMNRLTSRADMKL